MRAGLEAAVVTALAACHGSGQLPPRLAACELSQHACTWLGIPGAEGFNGDGHDRLDTKLYWAMDLKFAADGTPWLLDWNNHLVRRVLQDETVETVVGWTDPIFPGDGDERGDEREPEGALGTDVQLNHPTDLVILPDGTLMLAAWHNHKLRSIDPTTARVRVAYGAGAGFAGDTGAATTALFAQPKAVELDDQGQLYVLDQGNLRVRRIDAAGTIATTAGTGTPGFSGDGGPATLAELNFERGSNPEPTGGLAFAGNTLYVADTLNHRIRAIDLTANIITTIAGTGQPGFAGDGGPALMAALMYPRDLEIGPDGRLYVADTDNHRIRAIDLTTGVITTVAGTGSSVLDDVEGGLAVETSLKRPFGVEFDGDGNMYIADTLNSRYVRVAR